MLGFGHMNKSWTARQGLLSLLSVLLLCFTSSAIAVQGAPPAAGFYSVGPVIEALRPQDMGRHGLLKIQPPPVLYHWISLTSLKRLFAGKPSSMPLKSLGSDEYGSLLVTGAPAFKNVPGLYAWHNPIGAATGGTGEVYGNNEAVLAMQINPRARVGIVFMQSGVAAQARSPLANPKLASQYDLILHVSGDVLQGKVEIGYIEWAVLNPKVVTAVTANPEASVEVMRVYRKALAQLALSGKKIKVPPLEYLAGPQHAWSTVFSMDQAEIEKLEKKILKNKSQLPTELKSQWLILRQSVSVTSCRSAVLS